MYYSNRQFEDMIDRHMYDYVRSEHATVSSLDLIWGKQYYPWDGRMLIEFNYGIGYRSRDRNMTTYSVSLGGYGPGLVPAQYSPVAYGHLELRQGYPTIHLGLLIGFGFENKPNPVQK